MGIAKIANCSMGSKDINKKMSEIKDRFGYYDDSTFWNKIIMSNEDSKKFVDDNKILDLGQLLEMYYEATNKKRSWEKPEEISPESLYQGKDNHSLE